MKKIDKYSVQKNKQIFYYLAYSFKKFVNKLKCHNILLTVTHHQVFGLKTILLKKDISLKGAIA